MSERIAPDDHEEPKVERQRRLSAEGPLTWYGITFPNQEAKDRALTELQESLDKITAAEQAAWRDIKTNPTIY